MERTRMIVKGIQFGIVSLSIIGLIIVFFALAGSTDIPREGVWYCEELQVMVSFGAPQECYIMKNGEIR